MKTPFLKRIGLVLPVALALAATFAFAAGAEVLAHDEIYWFRNGRVTLPNSIRAQATGAALTANKVTRELAGSETFDYASQTITCVDSTGITITGAQVGDGCHVGLAVAPGNANFTCYVSAANTVKGHFCPAGTAVDPASQTFIYYTRSNQ